MIGRGKVPFFLLYEETLPSKKKGKYVTHYASCLINTINIPKLGMKITSKDREKKASSRTS